MNFIFDALEENPRLQIIVFTTKNTTNYKTPDFSNTKIYRIGTVSSNPLLRYASYVWFNLLSTFILLCSPLNYIIAFETLSVFPLWLVAQLKTNTKAHIHFHEYLSLPERLVSSLYMKLLFKFEDKILKEFHCSQTNEDRKRLFLNDKSYLSSEQVEVRPNLPPKLWWNQYGKFKRISNDGKIRLVYIGVCDNKTMYVKELLDWVNANQEILHLTIISQELDNGTKKIILDYNCNAVKIMQPIDYYDLPKELIKYDIGLVLYKGHTPNYIYNVPNKVYEYLSCGLQVLTDMKLITTVNLGIKQIHIVDFTNLNLNSIKKHLLNVSSYRPIYS